MIVSTEQRNRIHPHKFTLWVAIASIIMLFAGLTSAYIVKSGQAGWQEVRTPWVFYVSTALLLLSSLTIHLCLRYFRNRQMARSRQLLNATLILGIAFVVLQYVGFSFLWSNGVHFEGAGAGQFLYIIFGLHAIHVLGGIVALFINVLRQNFGKVRNYNITSVEILATYWHFVDGLWIYLLFFFILIK